MFQLIGSGYVLHGTGVELLLYKNQYFEKITAAQCLKTKPWPLLQIIAGLMYTMDFQSRDYYRTLKTEVV